VKLYVLFRDLIQQTLVYRWITVEEDGTPFVDIKGKAIPSQPWTDPDGLQEVEALRLQDNLTNEGLRLSALHTGRLYPPPGKYSWYSFLLEAESTPVATVRSERLCSMKNSNDTIGNRTRDLPSCSALRQRTASPRNTNWYKIANK
jgi:hypothetical protein